MDEESIIRDRVIISEASYKRLARVCQNICGDPGKYHGKEAVIDAEFDVFEAMISKLQLQAQMNGQETAEYNRQEQEIDKQFDALMATTAELEQTLAEVQRVRAQKEEYSEFVDAMIRPKKTFVEDEDGKSVPIIPQLNASRAEDSSHNQSLQEEIGDLQRQRDNYVEAWSERRRRFDEVVDKIRDYKTWVLTQGGHEESEGSEDEEKEEDEEMEGTGEGRQDGRKENDNENDNDHDRQVQEQEANDENESSEEASGDDGESAELTDNPNAIESLAMDTSA
uniref:ARAD1C02486p n=1 Tax=Blastobotrys adeninivorans TaxID=409370 RepID=A0A060T520_BLAAD